MSCIHDLAAVETYNIQFNHAHVTRAHLFDACVSRNLRLNACNRAHRDARSPKNTFGSKQVVVLCVMMTRLSDVRKYMLHANVKRCESEVRVECGGFEMKNGTSHVSSV